MSGLGYHRQFLPNVLSVSLLLTLLSACSVDPSSSLIQQAYEGAARPDSEVGEVNFCPPSWGQNPLRAIWAVDAKRMDVHRILRPGKFYPLDPFNVHIRLRPCIVRVKPSLRRFIVREYPFVRILGTDVWGFIRFKVERGHKYRIKTTYDSSHLWAVDEASGEVVAGVPKPSPPPTRSPSKQPEGRTAHEKKIGDKKTRAEIEDYWRDRIESVKGQGPYKDCELRFNGGIDPASFTDCEERAEKIKRFKEEMKRDLAS